VKALVAGGGVSCDPEPAGWAGFLLFGSVPEPYTIYQEIRAVPAGTTLWIDARGPGKPEPYFSIAEAFDAAECDSHGRGSGARDEVAAALRESGRQHLVADVPVGVFLSAGVDSGSLVGLMRDVGQQDIRSITLAYEENRGTPQDEAPLAEQVAAHYGSR